MAAAAPSPLTSSAEKTNGAKLSRLLIDGGTTVLRNVFDHYHPPANLAADLNANYLTLNDLLRKRVLHPAQWNQLLPPGGAIPDSKTFDITLLFLLLTNMCGLSPPLSGWHSKPPPSDTSFAANLARIKFFRNELYGHVTSTGVDTPSFNALWQEISAVLVALGLDQAEVDRLKAERCGEDDYLDVLLDWADSEQDIKSQLKDIRHELHKINIDKNEKRRERDRAEQLLRNLAKSEFKSDIEYHAQRFQEGTREWIFTKVDNWLDDTSSPNRVMVISGSAGMGKSVISSVICKRMQKANRLSGSHFCQHNNSRYRKPQLMLQSLACQLSHALPEYKNALVDQLSRNLGTELDSMSVEDLFALLFKEPLSKIADPGRNMLMVIDGLDEIEYQYQGRIELLDVIANHFFKLPQWIRFLVTTRPEINIADSLKHFHPIKLDENQDENLTDIELFFEMQLGHKTEEGHKAVILRKLVDKSEGVFLYAYFLTDFIRKKSSLLTLEQLKSSLPLGISSVYISHFKRLENELDNELKINEDQMCRFLCALTASREPLPVPFVSSLLNLSGRSLSVQRKINKAISSISSLLPVRDSRLHFFHKSVKDWLSNTSCYGWHDFTVDEKEGHKILFELCATELDKIKQKGVNERQFNDTEKYALQHCVQHMIEVDDFGDRSSPWNIDELVDNYVTNLELIYAKLCINSMASVEDLLGVQKNINALLNENTNSLLTSLLTLLRKHSYLLKDHPHLFFQSLINEGSPELSSRAAAILENRLPSVPYMKYLDKGELRGDVQARFYCSDTVACFDVSPEMDYLVCECRDETIHMWSLESGNKEWIRPSLEKRKYASVHPYSERCHDGGAYRGIMPGSSDTQEKFSVLTFYRSVVFHPRGVLPGTLRSVYSLKGDRNDLFPKSNCTFSHCAFPGDKKTMLTDCFDDPKSVVLWSVENGQELKRIRRNDVISSFAISQDGSQIALGDLTGSIYIVDVNRWDERGLFKYEGAPCGLMHLTPDNETLVCGYLNYRIDCLMGGNSRLCGWVNEKEPSFFLCRFNTNPSTRLHGRPWPPMTDFVLWPIEPGTLAGDEVFDEGFPRWVNNVRSVFPSLQTGFYKKLNYETSLVGSPSLKYVATVNVHLLNEVNYPSSAEVVKKVVFSSEGDAIYSISSDTRSFQSASESLVTVIQMSSKELLKKKTFTDPSLSLVPMKEGVVLCFKRKVPQLWNFDLTECIRPIARLRGAEKFTRISDELIACQLPSRTLTPDGVSDVSHSSVAEESLKLHQQDGSVDQNESLPFEESSNKGHSSVLEDSSKRFRMLVVDIINVTSGECISSGKTRVCQGENILFITYNSHNQLLVCTSEERDYATPDIKESTLSVCLINSNLLKVLWERSSKRYHVHPLTPDFIFSPKDEVVVTWNSLTFGRGLHILDGNTGETRHTVLKHQNNIVDCKFVVNGDTLVCCSGDNFLRLFHVPSGDLLSQLDIEAHPYCVGACLGKPLVAIGLSGARLKFIHVELPRVRETEVKKGSIVKQK